jgi:hypothetical protein
VNNSKAKFINTLSNLKNLLRYTGKTEYQSLLNSIKNFAQARANSPELHTKARNILNKYNRLNNYQPFNRNQRENMTRILTRSQNWTRLSVATKKRIISALGPLTTVSKRAAFTKMLKIIDRYSRAHKNAFRSEALTHTIPHPVTRFVASLMV